MGDVAQAEGNGIGVHAAFGQGDGLGVATDPGKAGDDPTVKGAGAAYFHHGGIGVADDGCGICVFCRPLPDLWQARQKAAGDIARSPRHIQQPHVRTRRQRVQ